MQKLLESDWNFDNVPDDELAACCLWEYARESKSFAVSSARHAEMREAFCLGERPASGSDPDYEAFLHAFWNCDEGWMQFYETIRLYGGPDALSWQVISLKVRTQMKKEVGVHQLGKPLALAMRRQLEALWKANLVEWEPVRNQPRYEPDDDSMAYESSHPHIEGPGHEGEPHGETIAAFTVDFRKFNDREICAALKEWLGANRPKDCPQPSQRGRKVHDLSVALDRLGMMRLLHCFTLTEMAQRCPEAWKAFEGYEWYKERKRSLATFPKLFPFLPKTERPVSWPTKGGRSK